MVQLMGQAEAPDLRCLSVSQRKKDIEVNCRNDSDIYCIVNKTPVRKGHEYGDSKRRARH